MTKEQILERKIIGLKHQIAVLKGKYTRRIRYKAQTGRTPTRAAAEGRAELMPAQFATPALQPRAARANEPRRARPGFHWNNLFGEWVRDTDPPQPAANQDATAQGYLAQAPQYQFYAPIRVNPDRPINAQIAEPGPEVPF